MREAKTLSNVWLSITEQGDNLNVYLVTISSEFD